MFLAENGHGLYNRTYFASALACLEDTHNQIQTTTDENQRRQLTLWRDYYESIVDAKPVQKSRIPNFTFDKRLEIHGSERSAILIEFVNTHSESDTVLFLPEDKFAFMGDLLCADYHPWLPEGDPKKFLHALSNIAKLTPEKFVPGHGTVGEGSSITTMIDYICNLNRLAEKMITTGETDVNDGIAIPKPYNEWLFASFFYDKLQFLLQRLLK